MHFLKVYRNTSYLHFYISLNRSVAKGLYTWKATSHTYIHNRLRWDQMRQPSWLWHG